MKDQSARADRYPGTRPFGDTEADQKTFYGRETEADDLTNQVLSSKLVVLYRDSGVGKTSLLQAGVFPLLRERDFLPLPIRLKQPPESQKPTLLEVCWAAIEKACECQKIKYTPGEKTGLWEFFKTAIFLKQAELQEPVLVFDQFEDIFDAYDRESRRAFARELGWLLGRTPPDRLRAHLQAGNVSPTARLSRT
jgi:conflict system STAND superfamily ATPase